MTLQDWRAYQRAAMRRLRLQQPTAVQLRRIALGLAIGVAIAWLSDRFEARLQLPGFLLGAVFAWIVMWLMWRGSYRRNVPEPDGAFLSECAYEFQAEGLRASRQGTSSFSSWPVVKAISITADHLFVWVDKFQGFVVPLRDVPTDVERDEFVRQVESWARRTVEPDGQWSATSGGPVAPGPGSAATAEALESADGAQATIPPARAILQWPATLLRLLALRNSAGTPESASAGLLALLACLALGTWIGVNWLENRPDPRFYVYGASDIAWYALMALALAAVLAWRSVPAVDLPRSLAIVLAAMPVLILARYLIDRYLSPPWTLVAALPLFLYCIWYAARGLWALSGRRQPQALVSGVLLAILIAWVTQRVYVDPSVWMTAQADQQADDEDYWTQAEPLLFSQSARIDAEIDAIAPSSDASPAAFFVGFAGYAEQRVFAEEIKLAARVVGDRYGSGKRSVLLVNDRRSLEALPLASPTALRYTLRRLATKMNTERDILFLALSSHGSANSVTVSNGMLSLQDLTAADLAWSLQESGIKWRVIVISACHAGSFIDELRNPDTILITASAANRTSFGCSDDRDLTYFGEAFYRDALPHSKSLREAFRAARAEIAARERSENVGASNPQASFGPEIEQYLESYEIRAGMISPLARTATTARQQ